MPYDVIKELSVVNDGSTSREELINNLNIILSEIASEPNQLEVTQRKKLVRIKSVSDNPDIFIIFYKDNKNVAIRINMNGLVISKTIDSDSFNIEKAVRNQDNVKEGYYQVVIGPSKSKAYYYDKNSLDYVEENLFKGFETLDSGAFIKNGILPDEVKTLDRGEDMNIYELVAEGIRDFDLIVGSFDHATYRELRLFK